MTGFFFATVARASPTNRISRTSCPCQPRCPDECGQRTCQARPAGDTRARWGKSGRFAHECVAVCCRSRQRKVRAPATQSSANPLEREGRPRALTLANDRFCVLLIFSGACHTVHDIAGWAIRPCGRADGMSVTSSQLELPVRISMFSTASICWRKLFITLIKTVKFANAFDIPNPCGASVFSPNFLDMPYLAA